MIANLAFIISVHEILHYKTYQMRFFCTTIIFSFVIVFLFSCSNKQEKTTAVVESITESVYASGIVKSKNQYQVFATVNGILNEIMATEGAVVKKGDALFKLQNVAAQLNTENAQLAAEFADIGNNVDKLSELKVNIELAKSKVSNDSLLLARQKSLWLQKIGSQLELEQRQLAYENSVTAYESAKLRYNDLKKQIEFSSKQSKKNLQISNAVSADFTIKSEIDGRVYDILKQNGELITSQMPLAVIGDANEFLLQLQVDEYDIAKVKPGQKILLVLDSYKGQVFEAEVSKIIPIMNERSRSFTVEAIFTKKPEALYPYLTVEANIVIQTNEKALTIPRSFLVEDSFVLDANNEKKPVVVGLKDYNKAEILKGLSEGETILKPAK
jgi:multidrug efflux pump subunit AcrA (membrane-fusion protein)